MFPRLPARAAFVADTNFVSGTQKMFDFVHKHFVSATNASQSQFAQPKKHHGQPRVPNNVSSFTRAFTHIRRRRQGRRPVKNVFIFYFGISDLLGTLQGVCCNLKLAPTEYATNAFSSK